jgi:hypothetical protein
MKIIQLSSGAELALSACSFQEGTKLMKAVAREIKGVAVSIGMRDVKNLGDILSVRAGDDVFNTIKNFAAGLLASEEIEAALWPCMERGTYTVNGVTSKINRDLFEDEKVRADYIPILREVLVYSLGPFSEGVGSLLKGIPQAVTLSQKS